MCNAVICIDIRFYILLNFDFVCRLQQPRKQQQQRRRRRLREPKRLNRVRKRKRKKKKKKRERVRREVTPCLLTSPAYRQ